MKFHARQVFAFFNNLQIRMIITTALLLFVAVLISLSISFRHTETLLEKRTSDLVLSSLQQMGNQVDNICLDMLKLSNVLSQDDIIISNLKSENNGTSFDQVKDLRNLPAEDFLRLSKIQNQLSNAKNNFFFNYNVDTMVISSDGLVSTMMDSVGNNYNFIMKYGSQIIHEEWFARLKNNTEYSIWTVPFYYTDDKRENGMEFISLANHIKSSYSGKITGIILVNVSLDNFSSIFKGNTGGRLYLFDKEGRTVLSKGELSGAAPFNEFESLSKHKGKSGFYIETYNHQKSLVTYYNMDRFGWSIVSVMPYNYVMSETTGLRNRIYSVNIIVFGIFIILSIGFTIYLTNPLKKLVKELKKKKIGVYSLGDKTINDSNDVNGIVKSFDHMFKKIDELVLKVIEDKKTEHDLRYESLKAQINPHFLFNTLNTMKWTAMMSGAGSVADMIADLGMLLEVSMKKGEEEITLRKEIELARAYINIQNARHDNRFQMDIHMEEELYDKRIIKLLLQPLIENAIIHGFKNKKEDCRIEINGWLEDMLVCIEVKNNGEILPQERIDEIFNENTSDVHRQKFSGIGLRNIHERLKYKFGETYGLSISSSNETGTVMKLCYPIVSDEIFGQMQQ